ncbi:uncharacterized protein [Anoplolepis gracilipes]|uniref:uncharacterized protein isoform X3 n=1 Tax=Anoplolepis gracilipes TaxID=354296 RepID=UPI003B9FFD3F
MVVIYNLPDEIIEAILTNEEVSIKDIVNFSSTCKKFLEIKYNNIFWMKKFSQRWPSAKKVYDEQNGNEKLNQVDFKKHIKIAIECIKQMRHYMSSLLEENYYYNDYYNNDIADINLKCHLVNNSWKYYILMDELNRNLFTQSLHNTNNDEYFYSQWVPDMPIVIQKKCQISSETYSKISLKAMACCWSCVPYIEHLLTENYLEITPILRELRSLEGHVIDRRNENKLLIDRIAILIEKEHRQRSEKIIFAVGMIVIHQDERNDKVGVIIGWHDRKNQNAIYYRHQESFMSLCKCLTTSEEFDPHYLILHDNNEICYIPQSSIKAICRTPKWINNSEIGRYFCKFEGTYYVPNEMLAKHYPNDAAVVLNMISKQ